jgi:hypothetical protein
MKLNESAISALSQLADPIGVISLYVGRPMDRAAQQPMVPLEIRDLVRKLEQDLKGTLSRRDFDMVHDRFTGLEPELDRMLEIASHGRGHALFAPVTQKDRVETIDVQLPLPTTLYFAKGANIRPLIQALDEGRPAGMVTVHRDGAHVFEWRLDETEEIEKHAFDMASDEWREMKGPSDPNPMRGQQSASHKDHYEKRVDANRQRFLKDIAARLGHQIVDRKWERLVMFGDARLTRPLVAEVPQASIDRVEVFFDDRVVDDSSPARIQEATAAILHEAQKQREVAMVRRAKELALARSRACLGLRDTLEALNQSRVQHLIFDASRTYTGFSTIDGQLFRERDKLAVQAGLMLQPEPLLIDRMTKRALETNAKVTPVEEQAAIDLADYDGIAALLRW